MTAERRILHHNWDLYDTRHVVFTPAKMTAWALEAGYWRAYRDFYQWSSILRGAFNKRDWSGRVRHLAYAAGWKKFEPLWDWVIRAKRVSSMLPALETVLQGLRTAPSPHLNAVITDHRVQPRPFDTIDHRL
jgi:hypothetical protein